MRQEYSEYVERFLLTESLKKGAQEEMLRLGKEATRLRTRLDKAKAVCISAFYMHTVLRLLLYGPQKINNMWANGHELGYNLFSIAADNMSGCSSKV